MFSWDATKAASNLAKHGVSFEEAVTIFADLEALDWQDIAHSDEELRSKRIGMSTNGRILIAVYTLRRSEDGKEAIRIISARQASRKERRAYSRQSD